MLRADGTVPLNWVRKAHFKDTSEAVNDIRFAPAHQGLRLATGSADGIVRVYEAENPMDPAHWPVQEKFDALAEGPSSGSREGRGGGVTCLDWNQSRFEPPQLVVGTSSGVIRVWQLDERSRQWRSLLLLPCAPTSVHDVAWAPALGRSTHVVAAACKDKLIRVWRFRPGEAGEARTPQELAEHDAEVGWWWVGCGCMGRPTRRASAGVVRAVERDGDDAVVERG